MAGHPLRPANHQSLGEPLPHQQANSTQAYPLAVARGHLSPRRDVCSINLNFSRVFFTKGQILTRYAPVRHSTRSRRTFLVRLACVKHAASVHSEPGSNSPSQNSFKFTESITIQANFYKFTKDFFNVYFKEKSIL